MFNIKSMLNGGDRDKIFAFLNDRLQRDGVAIVRSNNNSAADMDPLERVDPKGFRQLLHSPTLTPRQSRGVVFVPKGSTLHNFYVDPYESEHTIRHSTHELPMLSGVLQFAPDTLGVLPLKLLEVFRTSIDATVLATAAIDALNQKISSFRWHMTLPKCKRVKWGSHNCRLIVSEAVAAQNSTNTAISDMHGDEDYTAKYLHHVCTSRFTVVKTAVDEDGTSFGSKLLFDAPNRCADLKQFPDSPALGRGGAGPGYFAYTLLTHHHPQHSSTIQDSSEQQQWDSFTDANLANDPQRSTLQKFMQHVNGQKPAQQNAHPAQQNGRPSTSQLTR